MCGNKMVMLLVLAGSLVGPSGFAWAQTPQLADKLNVMAAEIKKVADGQAVKVGEISRGVNVGKDINSGTRLEEDLKAALRAQKVEVKEDAKLTILGTYSVVSSTDKQGQTLQVVRLKLDVQDVNGESLLKANAQGEQSLKEDVPGVKDIASLVQVSASLPPLKDDESNADERRRKLEQALKTPAQVIEGRQKSRIRASADGKYAVEILVQPNLQTKPLARTAELREGQAFVTLQKDEIYLPRIANPTDQEVAVSITIDGLNVFHFSAERNPDQSPRYSHFILAPKSTLDVPGWYQKLKPPGNYLSFLVTELGKGAVSQEGLASRGQVGVIHVTFSHSRPKVPRAKRVNAETGSGPPRDIGQESVEREIDPPHEFISIRYRR